MKDCIRMGIFTKNEKHPCFVIGCDGFCFPNTNETCSLCNFKFCSNGHCACNLSKEARYAIEKLYLTYCDFCKEYAYDFVRMPSIGKKGLTILEAKLDSVQILLIQKKPKMKLVIERIHHSLKIVRNALIEERNTTPEFMKIKRCTFRENRKTRCNKSPAKPIELPNGRVVYRCRIHNMEEWLNESYQPE